MSAKSRSESRYLPLFLHITPHQFAKYFDLPNKLKMPVPNEIIFGFREMYERMGDFISLQYGGSIAHRKKIFKRMNKKRPNEFITSIKRHFNNTITDQAKQYSFDIFLGLYQPFKHQSPIWTIPTLIYFDPDKEYLKYQIETESWWKEPIDSFTNFFKNKCLVP